MRVPLLVLALPFVAACNTVAPSPQGSPAVAASPAEASYHRERAVDAVTAQLLQAAVNGYETQHRVILENLANVDTVGFKRRVVQRTTKTVTGSDGAQFELPVVIGVTPICSQGVIQETGRNLDLAIDGDGFFGVTLADGSWGFTRDGQLQIDASGKLRTASGYVVQPEITVPANLLDLAIDPLGNVTCRTAGSPDCTTGLGQLKLNRFVNTPGLRREDGMLRITEASGNPITNTPGYTGLGWLKQGFVERSNVERSHELMQLQTLERQHEALVRVLREFGYVTP